MRYRLLAELKPRTEWVSLRLKVGGRTFSLGWNGQRLSRSGELRRLCTRYPAVAEDLVAFLQAEVPIRPERQPTPTR